MRTIARFEQARLVRRRGARVVVALLGVCVLTVGGSSAASAAQTRAHFRVHRLCRAARRGAAACMGLKLIPASLTAADLHRNATRQAEQAAGARPAVDNPNPSPGNLTPSLLHAAYQLPGEASSSALQTIGIVDAFDDPHAEADLAAFDKEFELPECTSANGCFRKLNEEGHASPLPPKNGGWAGEISIDVQMAHAICPGCRIVLVEAKSQEFSDLGESVNAAVAAGATVVSNSYGGPEEAPYSTFSKYSNLYFNHPGVVIAASSGDCGYLNDACSFFAHAADFPAGSPDVLAVGGTALKQSKKVWTSTTWQEGGSGCSLAFNAAAWQSSAANFAATGCAGGRSVADVSAIGDPNTGVDVYDSLPDGEGDPTGWGVWGGTSVASPIVAGEFALAGGAQSVSYPAETLYAHLGDSSALYDVISGSNGSCAGASSCQAIAGYDGPTGVGSPVGLSAFATPGTPVNSAPPTISGSAQQGQALSRAQGIWSAAPTSISDQWADCNGAGLACSPIAGATGSTYTPTAPDVGSTIRVQETAAGAFGNGPPAASAPSAPVGSNVPTFTGFTPASGITGSALTINGTALSGVTSVLIGKLASSFTAISSTEIEAIVPDGAKPGKITISGGGANLKSQANFTPTFSIRNFAPKSGAAGKLVSITGVGFTNSSTVAFNGVPATSVSFVSHTKLKAVLPPGAGSGAITVTNTAAPAGTVAGAGTFAGS